MRIRTPVLLAALIISATAAHAAPPDKTPPAQDAPAPIPDMRATSQFFSGALTVDVRFGRTQRPPRPDPTNPTAKPDAPPPDHKSGGGSGNSGKGKGHGKSRSSSDGFGGGKPPSGDPDERTPNIREERNPSTEFTIALTNNSPAPLNIEVIDFDSALGNFAVKPDRITIAPAQTVQTDPMISRLGIPTENLPLKIRVSNGTTTEPKTLTLEIQNLPSASETK